MKIIYLVVRRQQNSIYSQNMQVHYHRNLHWTNQNQVRRDQKMALQNPYRIE